LFGFQLSYLHVEINLEPKSIARAVASCRQFSASCSVVREWLKQGFHRNP